MKTTIMMMALCFSVVSYAEQSSFTQLYYFQDSGSGIAPETNLLLSADKKYLYGHRERYLYQYSLDNGLFEQITNDRLDNFKGVLTLSKNGKTIYGINHKRGANALDYVFRFDLAAKAEEVLHRFDFSSNENYLNGFAPMGGLVMDANEKYLYGVTAAGGQPVEKPYDDPWAHGVVYRIALDGAPSPSYQVLHSFKGDADAGSPGGSLVMSPDNKYVYGITTVMKNTDYCGTVFQLSLDESQQFPLKTLHTFHCYKEGEPNDLISSADGRSLYGTAYRNKRGNNKGIVFRMDLMPSADSFTVLHRFEKPEGILPRGLVLSKDQNTLLGATSLGDGYVMPNGSIYQIELDKPNFPLTILQAFGPRDTAAVEDPMVLNEDSGELYGFTWQGRGIVEKGAIFKIRP